MFKSAIVALCIATSVTWVAPAQAFPTLNTPVVAQPVASQTAVQNVDWHGRNDWRNRGSFRGGRGDFRYKGRDYGESRYHGGHYYGRDRYYGGYRHHGGNAAAIIGGLAAGAIIGGALSARPHHYGSHAAYCASRYRTYRASDNTYQPNNGPRRQCR